MANPSPDEGVRAALASVQIEDDGKSATIIIPGSLVLCFDPDDGVTYALWNGDGYTGGQHPASERPHDAAAEIAAALSTPVPEEGRTEMAGGDVIACVNPERWDHTGAPQLAYANGWNDALAELPRGTASAAEGEPVRWGDSGPPPGHFGDEFAPGPSPLPSQGDLVAWRVTLPSAQDGPTDFLVWGQETAIFYRERGASICPLYTAEALAEAIAAERARADSHKVDLDETRGDLAEMKYERDEARAETKSETRRVDGFASRAFAAEARADRAEEDERDRLFEHTMSSNKTKVFDWLRQQGAMLPTDRAALRARTILKETPDEAR